MVPGVVPVRTPSGVVGPGQPGEEVSPVRVCDPLQSRDLRGLRLHPGLYGLLLPTTPGGHTETTEPRAPDTAPGHRLQHGGRHLGALRMTGNGLSLEGESQRVYGGER